MYEVLLEKSAGDDLKRLPRDAHERISARLRHLSDAPRPPGSRKITGSTSDWRQRVGDYRIIYEIDDTAQKVYVYRIKHRKEAYR